jgi:hypothetical protein
MLYNENRIRTDKTYSLWGGNLNVGCNSRSNNKVGDSELMKFIKIKLVNWLLLALVVIMIFIVSIGVVAMVKPYNVLTFTTEKYKILTTDIHPGDTIKMQVDVIKNLQYPIRVSRQLVNHYVYLYAETVGNNPVGPIDNIVLINLPEYAETGIYYIHSIYLIKVNSLREVTYNHDSETFEVTKNDE